MSNTYSISEVVVYNRNAFQERLLNFVLQVYDGELLSYTSVKSAPGESATTKNKYTFDIPADVKGNKVKIHLPGSNRVLSLGEVEVYGTPTAPTPIKIPIPVGDPTRKISLCAKSVSVVTGKELWVSGATVSCYDSDQYSDDDHMVTGIANQWGCVLLEYPDNR